MLSFKYNIIYKHILLSILTNYLNTVKGQKLCGETIGKILIIYNIRQARFACCAARLADTLCPPEAPFGRPWSPLINYMGDNISNYVSPTIIIDIERKSTEFVNF